MNGRFVRWSRLVGRFCAAVGLIGLSTLPSGGAGAQDGPAAGPPPFTGTAAASGMSVTLTIPGFPATNTPLDASGPTAQVAVDSLGTSTGYAAFPYPGDLVISAPGLLAGLLEGGLAGLPPIDVPKLPTYPLYVSSDAGTAPEASVGAGPYSMTAKSAVGSGSATATGGLQTALVGNAVLVTSKASATSSADEVVFTATTDLQALTIGPLTLGQITATASYRLDAIGTVTPSSSIEISAVKIAGIPISLTPEGLLLGGPVVPLPLAPTLASLLSGANVTVEILAEQRFENRIVSPAVRITMPVDIPSVGTGAGLMTVILGAATASLTGAEPFVPEAAIPPDVSSGTAPATGLGSTGSIGSLPTVPSNLATSVAPAPASSSSSAAPSPTPVATTGEGELIGLFDIKSLYLTMVVSALAAWLMGQFIRLVGVRSAWTATAG